MIYKIKIVKFILINANKVIESFLDYYELYLFIDHHSKTSLVQFGAVSIYLHTNRSLSLPAVIFKAKLKITTTKFAWDFLFRMLITTNLILLKIFRQICKHPLAGFQGQLWFALILILFLFLEKSLHFKIKVLMSMLIKALLQNETLSTLFAFVLVEIHEFLSNFFGLEIALLPLA